MRRPDERDRLPWVAVNDFTVVVSEIDNDEANQVVTQVMPRSLTQKEVMKRLDEIWRDSK